jgi:hypothetical protein
LAIVIDKKISEEIEIQMYEIAWIGVQTETPHPSHE